MESSPIFYIVIVASMMIASNIIIFVQPSLHKLALVTTGRYDSLGALRGILAISVFIHHAYIARQFYITGVWEAPVSNIYRFAGSGSVAIFFMITGILFWRKAIDGKIEPIVLMRSRVRRIMPLYLFGCLVVFSICLLYSGFELSEDLPTITLSVTRWLAGGLLGHPDINGIPTIGINADVTWTLQYEWVFYILLPFLSRFTTPRRFALLAAVYMLAFLIARKIGLSIISRAMILTFPFAMGMITAYTTRRWSTFVAVNSKTVSLLVVITLGACAYYSEQGTKTLVLVLTILPFTLICMGNTIFGTLTNAPARWLGHISFSIYLLHGIILLLSLRALNTIWSIDHMSFALYVAVCASIGVVTVAICSVTYMLIERRFM